MYYWKCGISHLILAIILKREKYCWYLIFLIAIILKMEE